MNPEQKKQKTEELSQHVHKALRHLKMDETGTIACSKTYPNEEVRLYVWAYAFHKKKWFETRYDPTTQVMYATRGKPPPWEKEKDEDDWEEP